MPTVNLDSIDWKRQLSSDWPDIAGVVADGFDVSASDVQKLIPSTGLDLNLAADAINTFRGFLDGEISAEDWVSLAKKLGEAAGVAITGALTAAGTAIPIPGLGTAIGFAIGTLVSGIISLFDSSDSQRKAAIAEARKTTKENLERWEQSVFDEAWIALARLSDPTHCDFDKICPSQISTMIEHFYSIGKPCPDPTTCWGAKDEELSTPYKIRAREILLGWGFKPSGDLSFTAADQAFAHPLETQYVNLRGTMYRRPWLAKNVEWSSNPPTEDERFDAWKHVVEIRSMEEQKVANAFAGYFAQLAAIKSGFLKTVDAALKTGTLKKSTFSNHSLVLKQLRVTNPTIIGGSGLSSSSRGGGFPVGGFFVLLGAVAAGVYALRRK